MRREVRAQDFMPGDDLRERPLKRANIKRPDQAPRERHIIFGALRCKLVQKPEPLLGKGERKLAVAAGALDWGCYGASPRPVYGTGERGHRGMLEEDAHG